MKSVCAVVVTFNRCVLLEECLNSLLNQSYYLSKIYVINNNSTDNTKEFLDKIAADESRITPIHLNTNIGGAGGFYAGIKETLKEDYDWVWIMDDDAEPDENCLETLVKRTWGHESIGFVAPLIINKQTGDIQNYHHKNVNQTLTNELPVRLEEVSENKQININANAFVGPLISSIAIKKVGLPRKDFFIWLDDTEYTHRISNKFDSLLITEAIIYHKDSPTNGIDATSFWKVCYGFRNRMLWVNTSISGFNKWKSQTYFFLKYVKTLIGILLKPRWKNNRYLGIRYFTLAYIKGLTNQGGVFITPQDYINKVN